jgi:hypothetical protein
MAVMRKPWFLLMLLCLVTGGRTAFAQVNAADFIGLSLEDQIELYFDAYRVGYRYRTIGGVSSHIVLEHGDAVIPYLKEYLRDADFFSLRKNWPEGNIGPDGEANDITLELIAYMWGDLHAYSNPVYYNYDPTVYKQFTLDETEIQWFVDEYKRRIDEYVLATRMIDRTVMASETMIGWIAASGSRNWEEKLLKYGHPYFSAGYAYRGRLLKEYYEQRLGISGLTIDYDAFIE